MTHVFLHLNASTECLYDFNQTRRIIPTANCQLCSFFFAKQLSWAQNQFLPGATSNCDPGSRPWRLPIQGLHPSMKASGPCRRSGLLQATVFSVITIRPRSKHWVCGVDTKFYSVRRMGFTLNHFWSAFYALTGHFPQCASPSRPSSRRAERLLQTEGWKRSPFSEPLPDARLNLADVHLVNFDLVWLMCVLTGPRNT